MKLEMTGQMRMEQRMKLAPHMIQAMEILQLPILALQERIEQELNNNPVLELEELVETEEAGTESSEPGDEEIAEKDLVVDTDNNRLEDFQRLDSLGDDFKDHLDQSGSFTVRRASDEPDRKLEALKNTAAGPLSLHDHLVEQWGLIEASEPVKKAGSMIIDYIGDRGYLTVRLEQLHNKDRADFTMDDLREALRLVQQLEPAGVGARDLRECLLLQLAQQGNPMSFEYRLVADHMSDLLENRLPEIARKMDCTVERINEAVRRLSKLDTSPGLQVGRDDNVPIRPDVIIEATEDGQDYEIRLAEADLPSLRLNEEYTKMAGDANVAAKTRKFLQSNIRSAQWIMAAIEQRRNTLLRVAVSVVKHQRDYFDKGPLHLKPLPMSTVADDIGVHLATVSRAVAGKYAQCAWGIVPLRKFFSGGMEDANGQSHSWEAIRAQLQQIIDAEDKNAPLSDDQIREKLTEAGVPNLARRTVAKYRKLMGIPTARMRKKY